MVDRNERFLCYECDGFRSCEAHDDTADEAGAGGCGNTVEGGEAALGLCHGLANDHVECLDVRASRDFRDHSSESGVLFDLGQDHMCEYGAWSGTTMLDDGSRGFITGRLDAEHKHQASRLWTSWSRDHRRLDPAVSRTGAPSTDTANGSLKCPASPPTGFPEPYIRATVLVGHEGA